MKDEIIQKLIENKVIQHNSNKEYFIPYIGFFKIEEDLNILSLLKMIYQNGIIYGKEQGKIEKTREIKSILDIQYEN